MPDADRCVCCGEIVPEGRQICPQCERKRYIYTIPDIPPSLNKFAGRENDGRTERTKSSGKPFARRTADRSPKPRLKSVLSELHTFFRTRQRHDPDNYSGKFILDGLREAGIIEDDSFSNVVLLLCGDYDKENPRTEIMIKEVLTVCEAMIDLKHGDCLELMKDIPDDSVNLILTDPPYNLGLFMKNRATNLKAMRPNFFGAAGWDDLDFEEWKKSMDKMFEECARVSCVGASMIMFMSIIKVETIINIAEKHGFYYKTTGIWHKQNPMPRNMNLHFINSTEAWVYFIYKKRTSTFNNKGKAVHDFFETSVTPAGEKKFGKHPTQKPVALLETFVELLSNEGEVVFDPFMGSGSTGVACVNTNRRFIGIELDDKYFEIAKQRIDAAIRDKERTEITVMEE